MNEIDYIIDDSINKVNREEQITIKINEDLCEIKPKLSDTIKISKDSNPPKN